MAYENKDLEIFETKDQKRLGIKCENRTLYFNKETFTNETGMTPDTLSIERFNSLYQYEESNPRMIEGKYKDMTIDKLYAIDLKYFIWYYNTKSQKDKDNFLVQKMEEYLKKDNIEF